MLHAAHFAITPELAPELLEPPFLLMGICRSGRHLGEVSVAHSGLRGRQGPGYLGTCGARNGRKSGDACVLGALGDGPEEWARTVEAGQGEDVQGRRCSKGTSWGAGAVELFWKINKARGCGDGASWRR